MATNGIRSPDLIKSATSPAEAVTAAVLHQTLQAVIAGLEPSYVTFPTVLHHHMLPNKIG
jgi:hypothetical protein